MVQRTVQPSETTDPRRFVVKLVQHEHEPSLLISRCNTQINSAAARRKDRRLKTADFSLTSQLSLALTNGQYLDMHF